METWSADDPGAAPQADDQDLMGTEPMGQPGVPGQDSYSADMARQDAVQLARTRCRREMRCDHVGVGKSYSTMQQCEASLLNETQRELDACTNGINRDNLSRCMSAIDSQGCETAMDRLANYTECSGENICR